jgi:hypothetical protein
MVGFSVPERWLAAGFIAQGNLPDQALGITFVAIRTVRQHHPQSARLQSDRAGCSADSVAVAHTLWARGPARRPGQVAGFRASYRRHQAQFVAWTPRYRAMALLVVIARITLVCARRANPEGAQWSVLAAKSAAKLSRSRSATLFRYWLGSTAAISRRISF